MTKKHAKKDFLLQMSTLLKIVYPPSPLTQVNAPLRSNPGSATAMYVFKHVKNNRLSNFNWPQYKPIVSITRLVNVQGKVENTTILKKTTLGGKL